MSNDIRENVGPFRSELAAKSYRETFMIAQGQHSLSLSATLSEDKGVGWFVNTSREPKGGAT